ncbi:MAG: glycosyltransferase family 39 protein [Chloroflexi bacterium]|nr:glycosyltransferase family 39 protein [Chloroflexota bacterium]
MLPMLRAAALAVCMAGFALRWYRLGFRYLGVDEALSLETALLPLGEVLAFQQAKTFSHPPLYHSLLALWLPLSGTSELASRFPSLVADVSAVAAAIALGTALLGRGGGLVAGLLAAVSPFALYYAQEARMYSLVALLALLAAYGLWRHHRAGQRRWLVLAAVAVALGLLTHYYFVLAAVALGLAAAALALRRPSRLWALTAALVLAGLPFLAWLALAAGTRATVTAALEADLPTSPERLLGDMLEAFVTGAWREQQDAAGATLAGGLLVAAGVAVLLVQLVRDGRRRGVPLLLLAWLLVPLLVAIQFPWPVKPRYLMVIFPASVLVVTAGLASVVRGRPALLSAAGLALAALAVGPALELHGERRDLKSGFADAAQQLNGEVQARDAVALAGPAGGPLLRYYYRGAASVYPVTADTVAWDAPALVDSLGRIVAAHARVWLVVYAPQPQEEFVRGWFAGNAYELSNDFHSDTILASYVGGQAAPPSRVTDISFDGLLQLAAYQVGLVQGSAGRFVTHRTDWRLLRSGGGLNVSTRLVDQAGRLWADYDWWLPLQGEAGAVLRQNKALQLPGDAPAGAYRLQLVVYRRDGSGSLPARTEGRTQEVVELATVEVGPGS